MRRQDSVAPLGRDHEALSGEDRPSNRVLEEWAVENDLGDADLVVDD
ncbi:hypothetical protein [Haloterrigena salifodinae]